MAIKFEKIQPGMTLYSKTRGRMGNTTIKTDMVHSVRIISVDPQARTAVASWNGNTPEVWYEYRLKRLFAKKPKTKPTIFDRAREMEKNPTRGGTSPKKTLKPAIPPGFITAEEWVDKNNGSPVDTLELAERAHNVHGPLGDAARTFVDASEAFNRELEAAGYERG